MSEQEKRLIFAVYVSGESLLVEEGACTTTLEVMGACEWFRAVMRLRGLEGYRQAEKAASPDAATPVTGGSDE